MREHYYKATVVFVTEDKMTDEGWDELHDKLIDAFSGTNTFESWVNDIQYGEAGEGVA